MDIFSLDGEHVTHDCIRNASRIKTAFLKFPFASSQIAKAVSSGKWNFSFLHTCLRTVVISSVLGAATRMSRQRDLIGEMIFEVELAQRIRRRLPMYFSIVRRRADWASRDNASASLMMTTLRERGWSQRVNADARARQKLTFELMSRALVHLLRLRNLFEDILNDESVICASITAAYTRYSSADERARDAKRRTYLGVNSI